MIAKPFEIDEHQIIVGVSIGIAFAPQDGLDGDQLLKCADLPCTGRNLMGAVSFVCSMRNGHAMQARHVMELDLHQALDGRPIGIVLSAADRP